MSWTTIIIFALVILVIYVILRIFETSVPPDSWGDYDKDYPNDTLF